MELFTRGASDLSCPSHSKAPPLPARAEAGSQLLSEKGVSAGEEGPMRGEGPEWAGCSCEAEDV